MKKGTSLLLLLWFLGMLAGCPKPVARAEGVILSVSGETSLPLGTNIRLELIAPSGKTYSGTAAVRASTAYKRGSAGQAFWPGCPEQPLPYFGAIPSIVWEPGVWILRIHLRIIVTRHLYILGDPYQVSSAFWPY